MMGVIKSDIDNIMKVNLLDDFCVIYQGRVLNEANIKSDKVTKLLSYILCHRNKNLSVQELSDSLWEDDESDNPSNALKNLIYRTRNILKKNLGDYTFIITGNGYYRWNNEFEVLLDAENFENMCKESKRETDINRRMEYELKAACIYKTRFLPKYEDSYWIVTLSTFYHSMYIGEIKQLAKDLYNTKDYAELEKICQSALIIDEYAEDIHYYFIKALIMQDKLEMAQQHFTKTKNMFKEKLGVNLSQKFWQLYKELENKISRKYCAMNINETAQGAFYCSYDEFLQNCEFELKRAKKIKHNIYIICFKSTLFNEKKSEDIFRNMLIYSLRSQDVISQNENKEYMVLLSGCNRKNADIIMNRILDKCKNLQLNENINCKIRTFLEDKNNK